MTREHLETLTREELIDLILQLQAAVTEVKVKMAELEVQLASKRRPPKTSTNSSVPPSSDRKGNRQNTKKKKRGAKHGHLGKSRVRVEPDVFIECKLDTCPDCFAAINHWANIRLSGRRLRGKRRSFWQHFSLSQCHSQ